MTFVGIFFFIIGLTLLVMAGFFEGVNIMVSFIVGSILLLFIGFQFFKKGEEYDQKERLSRYLQQKEEFIAISDKIKVDLLSCKIQRCDYVEERAFASSERRLFTHDYRNELSGYMIREERIRAVVIFNTEINGVLREFRSPTLEKDKMTLRFLLGHQQETYLYIDKSDEDNYLFDFDFIDKELTF